MFGAFVLGLCRHVGAVVDIRACTETSLSKVNIHLKNTSKFYYTTQLDYFLSRRLNLVKLVFFMVFMWLIDGF